MKSSKRFCFTQTTVGAHHFSSSHPKYGKSTIVIDTADLTMDDIRELLFGFARIIQSIVIYTWNRELAKKGSEK